MLPIQVGQRPSRCTFRLEAVAGKNFHRKSVCQFLKVDQVQLVFACAFYMCSQSVEMLLSKQRWLLARPMETKD